MTGDAGAPGRWNDATRDVAPLLHERTCVVIVGERDDDAARAALALAHAHVPTRRVAVVDAVGELRPLQKLLPGEIRAHGVIDHFLHGVSLRRIAHAVNREGTLFLIPSGTGPFDYETLLRRERWRRLTMAFRGEGALLCIVLPPDAAGLAAFVEDTDGIVLVGDVAYPEPRHVIGTVRPPGRASADVTPGHVSRPKVPAFTTEARQASSTRTALAAAGVVVLVGVGAVLAWNAGHARDAAPANSAAADTPSTTVPAAGMIAAPEADSAEAAVYSVEVVMLNSLAAAGRHVKDRLGSMPAATFTPERLGADSARWYRVAVGAWRERRAADSALMALRGAGVLEIGFGSVRRTPYAVRVSDDMTSNAARERTVELRAQGLPAYVLERDADHAGVYAGAFETPSQATDLLDMFRRAGIDATVAYRIGRGI